MERCSMCRGKRLRDNCAECVRRRAFERQVNAAHAAIMSAFYVGNRPKVKA